jgi:phage-related protein
MFYCWLVCYFGILSLSFGVSADCDVHENQQQKHKIEQDAELFKKLKDDIWEFRTLYQGLQYRFLAFWDKKSNKETLVISTHGFIKKRSKVPDSEIQRATQIRTKYFEEKQSKDRNK